MEFDSLNLSESVLKGIYSHGFEKPSDIQARAIPVMIEGKDLIAQAQSGTGKTGTFSIGILQLVDTSIPRMQALVVSPTRELADQTFSVITSIGKHTDINVHKSVGGEPVREDINRLRDTEKPVHVTAGTPGRVIQMLEKNHMDVSALKIMVVDEADEMLKIGFRDQLCRIFQFIPETTQVAIFSATMPPEAMDISKKFMRDPVSILVRAEQLTLEGIRQYMIMLHHEENKFETLMDIYARVSVNQTIIFCNSKRKVNFLSENLVANGFTVSSLHADMDTKDRNEIYNQFKKGQARILVTTDVLSRGIDVQGVSIVINYDIPKNKECYIHRIGRSGRYGRKGTAINFVTNEEVRDMKAIERFYETQIDEMPVNFDKYL